MHPAPSLILFTTLSGAGYGLLFLLALLAGAGLLPPDPWLGFWGLGTALALVSIGLLASTLHLGHPERAWRAFSQWRSSWLSREGVLAVLTYLPALLLAWGWVIDGEIWLLPALLTLLGAAVTVWCTAMIYASLKPIPRWHNPWVPACFLGLGLANGALLLTAIAAATGRVAPGAGLAAGVVAAAAWLLKLGYWRATDAPSTGPTIASATGLGGLGPVRLLEPPHTGGNYLTREMGFRVARKHARKLRLIAPLLAAAVPLAAGLLALPAGPPWLIAGLAILAAAGGLLGTLVERWLFFAEARHTVMLYYGEPGLA
jgi:DMSO reductase anchor subunit